MNKMKRYILIILISIVFIKVYSQEYSPKREVRAVWITTIGGLDWPHSYAQSTRSIEKQKLEFINILDKLKKANINTILLQTRVRATTIYPSQYEPWDGCMSGFPGTSPGYDPLQFAIEECHKRGMELHAWVVTMPIGNWNSYGCKKLRQRYPNMIKRIGNDGFMNPEKSQTSDYISNMCYEIIHNYDVDGIHLDYIRYPETWNIKINKDNARENITRIVRKVHDKVKSEKPWVKISCSPIGKFSDLSRYWSHGWNAYDKVCQDAQGWMRDGLMDEVFPMMYFQGDQFFPFAVDWSESNYGKIVAIGLGIYFMDSNERDWPIDVITREMNVSREFNMGYAFFRSRFFTDNTKGIYDFTYNQFNQFPSLVPAMTWEKSLPPSSPSKFDVKYNKDYTSLSWTKVNDNVDSTYILYNVYASNTYPVDISKSCNLIASRLQDSHLILKNAEDMYFAVTSMDRYGNESKSSQMLYKTSSFNTKIIKNDGNKLLLPSKGQTLDADYVLIESLQGNVIGTRKYTGKYADIKSLRDGFYVLRLLNKKGKTHRLGYFIIKR